MSAQSEIRRPMVTLKSAKYLAENLYGISDIKEISEFTSYSDRNFYIRGRRHEEYDSIIQQPLEGEYVLKILNAVDSRDEDFINAENSSIEFLRQRGFPCPEVFPVKGFTKPNKMAIKVELPVPSERLDENENLRESERCIARLIKLVPGKTLDNFAKTEEILQVVGEFIGSVSKALMDFSHPAIRKRYSRFDLKNFLALEPYIHLIDNDSERCLVREIFEAFEKNVKPHMNQIRQGTIHNDMNSTNILLVCNRTLTGKKHVAVSGLIDFGDINHSMAINDIVSAMVSNMNGDNELEVSGHLLAGYQASFPIPTLEYEMLYVMIAARICQIVVISNQSLQLNEDNSYVKGLLESHRCLLKRFWSYPIDEVENIWLKCQSNYNFKGSK